MRRIRHKNKILALSVLVLLTVLITLTGPMHTKTAVAVNPGDDGRIKEGIFAGKINLSGMSETEASSAVERYIKDIRNVPITLEAVSGNQVTVTAGELGVSWQNTEILKEAAALGRKGNVVKRYKELKDLQQHNKVYSVNLNFSEDTIRKVLNEKCTQFNQEPVDATLKREGTSFSVVPGQNGMEVDVNTSASKLKTYLETLWDREEDTFTLEVSVVEPHGKESDLEQVTDVLGTFTTSFSSSAKGRSGNVRNGCSLINGTLLYPGEQISVYDKVSPFSEENGYYLAGSYNNGMVVETLGGGICQVSSTLYNAAIRAELQIDERSPHSMVVSYVDLSADAAISGTYKDLKFTNNTGYPIYIDGYTTDDKQITFTIFGKETRPENRKISFETEKISEEVLEEEKVIADSEQPVGYISVQSAHTGYEARYWKIVKVDGVETERIQINSSKYNASPKTATVGTQGDETGSLAAAIATQSIDTCKGVADQLLNAASAAASAEVQEAQEAAAAAEADAEAGG